MPWAFASCGRCTRSVTCCSSPTKRFGSERGQGAGGVPFPGVRASGCSRAAPFLDETTRLGHVVSLGVPLEATSTLVPQAAQLMWLLWVSFVFLSTEATTRPCVQVFGATAIISKTEVALKRKQSQERRSFCISVFLFCVICWFFFIICFHEITQEDLTKTEGVP